jgi:hypothetical protein
MQSYVTIEDFDVTGENWIVSSLHMFEGI